MELMQIRLDEEKSKKKKEQNAKRAIP